MELPNVVSDVELYHASYVGEQSLVDSGETQFHVFCDVEHYHESSDVEQSLVVWEVE